MTASLITVVLPCHNGERYLAETLANILAQSWRPLDLVVANDGSTDGTLAVAEGVGEPVRVVSQPRSGPAAARNLGIVAARGSFIAFIDHDDLWLPEKLALQMAAFDADPALDVCVGHVQRFYDDANGQRVMSDKAVPGYLTITMLAKRTAFDRVGLFDATRKHSDSAEWFLRANAAAQKVRLLPDLLTLHRDHCDNRSVVYGDRSRHEFLQLIKAKIDRERTRSSRSGDGTKPAAEGE